MSRDLTRCLLCAAFVSLFLALSAFPALAQDVQSITISGAVVGGSTETATATVTLTGPFTHDVGVSIWSSGNVGWYIGLQNGYLIIPAGEISGTFQVGASGAVGSTSSMNVMAAISNATVQAALTVEPTVITVGLGGSVIGGSTNTISGSVSLNAATLNNVDISFSSQNGSYQFLCFAQNPPKCNAYNEIVISAGQTTATYQFSGQTLISSSTSVPILATYGSNTQITGTATVTIAPDNIHLSAAPSMLTGGSTEYSSANFTLDAPLLNQGTVMLGQQLIQGNNYYLSFYNSSGSGITGVVVPAGQSAGSFTIKANSTTTNTAYLNVTATLDNIVGTAPLTVFPLNNDPGPCKQCPAVTGQPINLANGNTWVQQRDYSLPGLGGGLQLTRTWNSIWPNINPISLDGMFGHSWRSTYEERLDVSSVHPLNYWQGDGSLWYFEYSSGSNTYSLVFPPNEHAALSYDSVLLQYTLALPDGSEKLFNNNGYLIALINRNGNQTTIAYDSSNRITTVTDAAGRSLTFTYQGPSSQQVQSVADATGTIATYSYDAYLRLTKVTYADNSSLNFSYDINHLVLSVTDANGKVIESHTYDSSRRGLTSQRANGAELLTVSYPSSTETSLTDSLGNVTTYGIEFISGRNFVSSITGPGCVSCGGRGTQTFGFDASGNTTSVTDANGNTTTYTYDSTGNVLTRSNVLGTNNLTWTYTYNGFNEVLTAADPLGNTTTNTYDPHGNLLTTTTPSPDGVAPGSTTMFTYDAKGELLTITDPLNNKTTLAYYPTGLINTITEAQNNVTSYAYDARGNRSSITDAANKATSFAYDAMNRLTKITYPDTTTTQFAYDTRGRRTSVTDQNGKTTTHAYDDADRLTAVTDATNNTTSYAYDSESNLLSITDANGHATSFTYDPMGHVTKTTFPSTLYETYSYDPVGNLTSKTDRKSQTINYTYDQLNRLTHKTYPDSTTVNYTYDNDSRLTQVTDPTGTYSFTFDNMGRLTGTSTSYSFLTGRNFTTSYTYDAASNRTGFTDPEGGSTTYAYDTLNRLTTLTPPSAFTTGSFGFSYDALSRRTQMTRPNNVTTNYTYDSLSRLLSVLHQVGSTTLDGATYALDNAGNRTAKTDQYAGVTSGYSYDAIYELTQVLQGTNTTESYTYDPVGNRLSSLRVSPYSYNVSNELTSTPNATYGYDSNGNAVTKNDSTGITTYAWDFENRLTSVALPGSGGSVSFKYDPFGRRIYKSSSSGTSIYAYDGDNLVEETNSSGSAVARYSDGLNIDEPLAMLRSGATSFYQADGLGTITSLTNTAGALAQTYTFDSFGKQTASSGSLTNPFQYTGREFDPETSLYYYRARYYDPTTGRFLSEDPIGFSGGIDFYAYVANDPVDWIDPLGLFAEVICEPIPSTRGGWKYAIPMLLSRAHHCFIHVKCDDYDVTLELYGPSAQDPRHGSPHMNPYNPNRGDIHVPIQVPSGYGCCTFENNLLKNFQKDSGNVPIYNGLGPNSNTFVYTIVTQSGGSVNMPPTAYGWDYLPPAPPPASPQH